MPKKHIKLFISHATEDKDSIVRPLAEALVVAGYSVWYDEYSLRLGDSLRERIDHGLANSDYGIVVLSPAFFAKHWTQKELDGLMSIETSRGIKVILPVWHQLGFAVIATHSPILAGRVAVSTARGIPEIVRHVREAINDVVTNPFKYRIDLEDSCPMMVMSSGGGPSDWNFSKVPGVPWTKLGEEILEEFKRLDKANDDEEKKP